MSKTECPLRTLSSPSLPLVFYLFPPSPYFGLSVTAVADSTADIHVSGAASAKTKDVLPQ